MTMDIFEMLPAELNFDILWHLRSLRDVQNAASSSPTLLQVFTENKKLVFLNWLERNLGADNLMDILTVVSFSQFLSTMGAEHDVMTKRECIRSKMIQWLASSRPWDMTSPMDHDLEPISTICRITVRSIDETLRKFNTSYTLYDARLESFAHRFLCSSFSDEFVLHSIMNVYLPHRIQLLRPFFFSRLVLHLFLYSRELVDTDLARVQSRVQAVEGRVKMAAWQILNSAATRAEEWQQPHVHSTKRELDTDLIDAFRGQAELPTVLATELLVWIWPGAV